jgi:hypothetical protein
MVSPNILSSERKHDRTTKDTIVRCKLFLLDLVAEFSNVNGGADFVGWAEGADWHAVA